MAPAMTLWRAVARSAVMVLLAVHAPEILGQINLERLHEPVRLPLESFGQRLGRCLVRPPALDEPVIEIDDPVLGDSFILIEVAFRAAIGAARRARAGLAVSGVPPAPRLVPRSARAATDHQAQAAKSRDGRANR